MNRLADSTSPYLLQHANDPVEWWPWGPEAFAEARRRDLPVLLSIGYAACHWCHVMAHESFADLEIASLINELTVPIKVDREERPDIDAVYMAATQTMSGRGGWPMTVFAAADGSPFLCGTYYPPQQLTHLLLAVAEVWRERRSDVLAQGAAVVAAIDQRASTARTAPGASNGTRTATGTATDASVGAGSGDGGPRLADPELLSDAVTTLLETEDRANGGFGGAPKFPPHLAMLFLLRHHQRTGHVGALAAVSRTCEAMARGGMYDQLAGGFARYSVDATWTVPHFEKMLYDNALLLRVYTQLWRVTGDALAARVAAQIATFLGRDLLTDAGALASSLDADADGVEGRTYVWTPAQLVAMLGQADGQWAAETFGVGEIATFEHGSSVLRLPVEPVDAERLRRVRSALLAARAGRAQPARDDKIVAAWNGLAVTALVEYAMVFGDADAGALAEGIGRVLAETHLVDGRLRRVSRNGVAGAPAGVAEDYGCVAEALCALHQYTADGRWLELANGLLDTAIEHFGDGFGGFFDTPDDGEPLVTRPAELTDNATPSGHSALAAAMVSAAALGGARRYREVAERALAAVVPLAVRYPQFTGYACAAAEAMLSGPYEIAVVSMAGRDDPMAVAAWRHLPAGAVVVAGAPDTPGVPLLAGRDAGATYLCREFVCDRPVGTVAELVERLTAH